jgi:MFS family permease
MRKTHIFYGYWILGTCCLFCMISMLESLSAFSLFVRPLQGGFGWSRTEIMAGFTCMVTIVALTSPVAGRLIDRYGARKVMVPGALIAMTGLVLLSRMTSLPHLYVGYSLIGVGSTATGPVGLSYVVSRWFRRKRGMALGIMSGGIGLTGIVLVPLTAVYLIPHFGWGTTYSIMALLTGTVILPLSFFVLRTKPADLGLYPDGVKETEDIGATEGRVSVPKAISLKVAVATSAFWLIALSLAFNHTHVGVFQSVFPHLGDLGFPVSTAASVMSVCGAMGCTGMFLFGWLCDRIAPKRAAAIGLALIILGISLLVIVGPSSPPGLLYLFAAVMGLGTGSWMPTMSMLTSTTFGMASYGAIFGTMSFFQYAGAALGPLITGYSYDAFHSYHRGLIAILLMVATAIPLVLAVPKRAIPPQDR